MKPKPLFLKKLTTLAALVATISFGFAQGTFVPKINSIPSSPEAALLERFQDIPVSYYTGTPEISIPLYTIKQNGIEIPMVLKYQTSGVKVADEATWVGLGWSLDPGGSISQEVRGKNDDNDITFTNHYIGDSQSGYNFFKSHLNGGNYASTNQVGNCMMHSYNSALESAWHCDALSDPYSLLVNLQDGNGQPDIYHYNLPGYSGQYFINPETGVFKLIDKKAEIKFTHGLQTITAVTPDGTIYNFNTYEDAHAVSLANVSGRTYKLTSVAFPTSNGQVTFSYADELYTSFYNQAQITLNDFEIDPGNFYAEGPSTTTGNKKRLSQISTPDVTITFNVSGREDFLQNSSNTITKLESIDIRSAISGKLIKSLKFTYEYINPTGAYQDKRLKLKGVQEIGYDYLSQVADTSKPGYLFDYDETVALPAKNSRSVDFWGYYNGSPNTTLIPDLDFFDYTHDAAFVTDSGVPIFDYNPSYKANRYPNNTYAKAYLLKKVTYPTGGYTQYEFEPHTFDNQFIPNQQQLTAMQQTPSCNTGPYYTWTQNWPLSIHENTTLPMTISFTHGSPVGTYADNDKSAMYNSTISYVRISKTLNGVVTQLKTWTAAYNLTTYAQFNTNGGTNIFENFNIVYEAGATYKLEVSCPVLQSTTFGAPTQAVGVHATTVYYDKLAIPQISQQQGFRIKSIKSYSSLNVLAYNKQYSYTGGKLLNTFLPLKWSGTAYHFGWDGVNYTTHFNKRVSLCTEYFSSPGNPVGYDMVEEVTCDKNNLATNGKKQYYFQNVMNIGTTGLPTALNFHNGTLDKEQTYNKDGVLQEEKIQSYIYLPFTDPNFTCITIENHQFGGVDGPPSSSFQSGQPYINYKFSYNSYPLLCDWYMLGSTLTNQYLDGNTLSSLTTYEYNSTGQQKSVITATSLQEQEKISMAYADDYPYGDAIEQTMIDNHMINIPIRTQEIKNSVTLSTTKNGFIKDATTVNNILLKYIYTLKDATGGSLEKRVTYDLYDSRGNLLQYHLENGINVSIIWGYNQTLPVAKLENVAYASISTTTLSTIASQSTPSPAAVPNETNLLSTLNGLRTTFPAAMITTYTYKPGVGVQTITDPKGDKITYTYDAFGRLLNVKDKNNNILSENEYHFKP